MGPFFNDGISRNLTPSFDYWQSPACRNKLAFLLFACSSAVHNINKVVQGQLLTHLSISGSRRCFPCSSDPEPASREGLTPLLSGPQPRSMRFHWCVGSNSASRSATWDPYSLTFDRRPVWPALRLLGPITSSEFNRFLAVVPSTCCWAPRTAPWHLASFLSRRIGQGSFPWLVPHCYRELNSDVHYQTSPLHRCLVLHHSDEHFKPDPSMGVSCPRLEEEASWPSCPQRTWHVYQLTLSGRLMANGHELELAHRLQLGESQVPSDIISTSTPDVDVKVAAVEFSWSRFSSC